MTPDDDKSLMTISFLNDAETALVATTCSQSVIILGSRPHSQRHTKQIMAGDSGCSFSTDMMTFPSCSFNSAERIHPLINTLGEESCPSHMLDQLFIPPSLLGKLPGKNDDLGSSNRSTFQGLPLSHYSLTESEVVRNLDNKDWFIKRILLFGSAIAGISESEHLIPGPVANTLFGGLVLLVREFPTFPESHLLCHPTIVSITPRVIHNCGIAEYYLEAFFASRVISNEVSLSNFPYYGNYRLLMSFEAKSLRTYMGSALFNRIKKVAFIGSGPLPLSSIEILRHVPEGAEVVNYDQNAEAVELGQSIVTGQALSHRISFVHASAVDIRDLGDMDVVYLAALAGGTRTEKREITEHLYGIMKPRAVLVARSATGLRTFIYERLTEEDFGKFQAFRHFDPSSKEIINSVGIGMKMDPMATVL